jgi:hypothetical protein
MARKEHFEDSLDEHGSALVRRTINRQPKRYEILILHKEGVSGACRSFNSVSAVSSLDTESIRDPKKSYPINNPDMRAKVTHPTIM